MSGVTEILPGETVTEMFYHANSGLAGSAFTVTFFRDGVQDSSITASIVEVVSNFYKLQFTVDNGEGVSWWVDIYETSSPSAGRYQGSWRARNGLPVNVTHANGEPFTDSAELSYIKTFIENIYSSLQQLIGRIN